MEVDIKQLGVEFRKRFSTRPRFFRAPGRVNLIGEHTDYNDGFVMPFAIDRHVLVAAALRDDRIVNVQANDIGESNSFDLSAPPVTRRGNWMDYVEGAIRCLAERAGAEIGGADLMITASVPIGAGLSSSAAIETAVAYAVVCINQIEIDKREIAFASQQAEHQFVGIRSGIMDQFAAIFGREGNAMLLDCRSLEIDYIPLPTEGVAIAVIDTKVKHTLASTEYNTRREECEKGVEILRHHLPEIKSLRDLDSNDLKRLEHVLPEPVRRRVRHVVLENERTLAAAAAFRDADYVKAGKLMFESHRSLRDDYEVSSVELDFLVDIAGQVPNVYGARMTGGGFGGCTVNLVGEDSVDQLRSETASKYAKRFGFEPDFYIFEAANGVSELTL